MPLPEGRWPDVSTLTHEKAHRKETKWKRGSRELSGRVDSDSGLGGEQEMLARAREKLAEVFGYASFRPGQEDAIAAVANGQDALVVMPTGSGKSLCYQVPALVLDGVTVVVSPLIALMKDQVDALKIRGVPVTFVNSSIDLDEQWARLGGPRARRLPHRVRGARAVPQPGVPCGTGECPRRAPWRLTKPTAYRSGAMIFGRTTGG
jgi:hypothetical protein